MKKELVIEGMSCKHCVMALKNEFSNIKGISSADVQIGSAVIEHDETVTDADIAAAVEEAGYRIVPS